MGIFPLFWNVSLVSSTVNSIIHLRMSDLRSSATIIALFHVCKKLFQIFWIKLVPIECSHSIHFMLIWCSTILYHFVVISFQLLHLILELCSIVCQYPFALNTCIFIFV